MTFFSVLLNTEEVFYTRNVCFFKDFWDTFWWFVVIWTCKLINWYKCKMAHSTVKASNSIYLISVFYEILARKRSFLISVYIWSHQIKLLKGHAFSACLLRSCIIRYQTSMNLSGRETFNNGNLCRSFKTLHFAAKVIGKIEQNQPYMSQNLPIRKINK